MRGFPLLQILSVGAGLLLLGVPVWMLTSHRPVVSDAGAIRLASPPGIAVFSVQLTTTSPALLSVMAANHPTCESVEPVQQFEARFEMPSTQPEDLAIIARFGLEAGPEALRAEVRTDGRLLAEKTFWGEGEIQDVVEIPMP